MPMKKQAFHIVFEAVKGSPEGMTSFDLMEKTGLARSTIQNQLARLTDAGFLIKHQGRACNPCVWTYGNKHIPSPKPRTKPVVEVVPPRRPETSRQFYVPGQWSHEIARPGSTQHEQYGSLQADGSVKPRKVPTAMCVGFLKDNVPHTRD